MKYTDILIKILVIIVTIFILFYSQLGLNLLSKIKTFDSIVDDIEFEEKIKNERERAKEEIKEAEEKGYTSSPLSINPNNGPDLRNNKGSVSESFEDTNDTLYLFYTQNCRHSQEFLPTWTRIKNRLPANVTAEQHDCLDNRSTALCNRYRITAVPTIILIHSGSQTIYNGNRSEEDLTRFLKVHGINLGVEDFEGFENNGPDPEMLNINNLDEEISKIKKSDVEKRITKNRIMTGEELECPKVTFDKKVDRANNIYSYQIFDENGVYGYSKGGTGQPLDSYHAAYNCFDTYLSTLPQENMMEKCAMKYKKQIRDFELCDSKRLNEIENYGSSITNGSMLARVDDVDYDGNKKVVSAIKKACSL